MRKFLYIAAFSFFLLPMCTSLAHVNLSVDERIECDLRLLADGALQPLKSFMSEQDYHSVLEKGRLSNNKLFPIPIVLPVPKDLAMQALEEGELLLTDEKNNPLAICKVSEVYEPDLEKECISTFGTISDLHPGVKQVISRKSVMYVSGTIIPSAFLTKKNQEEGILTPIQAKEHFAKLGWSKIVAFQTRNPLHFAHIALIKSCLDSVEEGAGLFLHPVVGPTQSEDIPASVRRKCYEAILPYLKDHPVKLSYLPLSMRMAGPKEALLHAIIRKNYGVTHFIIGRDHAGPSVKNEENMPFYGPYEAQKLVLAHSKELGIEILTNEEMVYVEEYQKYIPLSKAANFKIESISGSQLRNMLSEGKSVPSWFSTPEVVEILRKYYAKKDGLCIYLVGLSGSGKSTIAEALKEKIEVLDIHHRVPIILDGDVIRKYLSSELGFSKKDRSINVRRIGYVASLIVQSGGICICANIAPYEEDRLANRELISKQGAYFEVFVDTPLEVCEKRDVKGLYKLARQGKIPEFTGISDPFEIPGQADCVISGDTSIEGNIKTILSNLKIGVSNYR